MNGFKKLVIAFIGIIYMTSCTGRQNHKNKIVDRSNEERLKLRYSKLLEFPVDSMSFPRSMNLNNGVVRVRDSRDWTSGFFPGNLWYLFMLTGEKKYKEKAREWTVYMEKEKNNRDTHDIGFMINCSFGTGYKATNNEDYQNVLIKAAKTLSERFNNKVGCIRSWDFGQDMWEYPVIIDNMMNLELLFEATAITGDSLYHQIAIQHANTTLRNHFRSDNSTYHVVDYDSTTGQVRQKMTHQGLHDESSWARGQAWTIYGYTMAYRYTKDSLYLNQAEATAKYYLEHEKLSDDGIPFWDFMVSDTSNAPKDVSAATIVASACFEMYGYTQKERYIDYAQKVIETLMTENYLLEENVEGPFILDKSTGNLPDNDEISVPIVYADYYFLEALFRNKHYLNHQLSE